MNLLRPLDFEPVKARKFALRHRCALCLGVLLADDRRVVCPSCGEMYQHTVTSIHKAEAIQSERTSFGRELRPEVKSDKSEADLLKELGYE